MSYDLDESSEYTSASPATVIAHVQFIISVNLFNNTDKQTNNSMASDMNKVCATLYWFKTLYSRNTLLPIISKGSTCLFMLYISKSHSQPTRIIQDATSAKVSLGIVICCGCKLKTALTSTLSQGKTGPQNPIPVFQDLFLISFSNCS
jgi:hypothetical protein